MKKIKSVSLKIGKVIHDELADILDVYPVIAPQNTTGTFGVYRRTSLSVSDTKDIYNYEEKASVEIAIITNTYSESLEKAILVKMYLEHLSGEYETSNEEIIHIGDITLIDCTEEWTGDSYVQTMKFIITIFNEPEVN